MEHDETSLVKQAVEHAQTSLSSTGRVLPAAYMLVRNNPQTGAKLTNPTAIGTALEQPLATQAEYLELLATLREEAQRLDAMAVALCGEAQAEIEDGAGTTKRRVFFIRIEDRDGVHHLHAPIEGGQNAYPKLGELVDSGEASDDVDEPLLTRAH